MEGGNNLPEGASELFGQNLGILWITALINFRQSNESLTRYGDEHFTFSGW